MFLLLNGFSYLLERTVQQVPLVAIARDLGELELISGISQPVSGTPFRNCNAISQHPGESYEQIRKFRSLKLNLQATLASWRDHPSSQMGEPSR